MFSLVEKLFSHEFACEFAYGFSAFVSLSSHDRIGCIGNLDGSSAVSCVRPLFWHRQNPYHIQRICREAVCFQCYACILCDPVVKKIDERRCFICMWALVWIVFFVPKCLVWSETLYHTGRTLLLRFASVRWARMKKLIDFRRWQIVVHILWNRSLAFHPNKGW